MVQQTFADMGRRVGEDFRDRLSPASILNALIELFDGKLEVAQRSRPRRDGAMRV
jgi:hypothetical protein